MLTAAGRRVQGCLCFIGNPTSEELQTLSRGEQLSQSSHVPVVLGGKITEDSQELRLKKAWKAQLVVLWVKVLSDRQNDWAPVHPLAPLWDISGGNDVWGLELSCLLALRRSGVCRKRLHKMLWLTPCFSLCTETLTCIAGVAALQIRISCSFFNVLVHTRCRLCPVLMVVVYLQSLGHLTQCSSVSSSSCMVNWKYKAKSVWTPVWAGGKGAGSMP